MSGRSYEDLLYRLGELRRGDEQSHTREQRALAGLRERVAGLEQAAMEEQAHLAETAQAMRTPLPDLRPLDDAADEASAGLDAELSAGHECLKRAAEFRERSFRAAQQAPFLPRAHHLVRNFAIYAIALAGCFLVQRVALLSVSSDQTQWWLIFLPPVMAVFFGWLAVTPAATPRVPMVDASGNELKPIIFKSPRLGAFLAVVLMVINLWLPPVSLI